MATTALFMPRTADTSAAGSGVLVPAPGHLRLCSCPRCGARGRSIIEVGGVLRGGCVRCGALIEAPLRTERHSVRLVVAGPVQAAR